MVVVSAEDIEDDEAKQAETDLFDDFAHRIRTDGLAAAWEPRLADLVPLIANLVREAMGRADPASIAAAAAIGRDRAFADVHDLGQVATPTLIIPGDDPRHPALLAERLADVLRHGRLEPGLSAGLSMAEELDRTGYPGLPR